ncbi:MAG: DUF192 domain-containing protein [Elusimicrobia bacterium]|nr:DUF192 domain-containing protein [Elusimicrobiota bacterium]MBU2615465.1 DUF192 domain-containing protein [Elusimicrobiota bacterium]
MKKIIFLTYDCVFFILTFLLSFTGILNAQSAKILKNRPEINLTIDTYTVKTEIANTFKKKSIGLMNRKTLEENSGMLFVFPIAQHLNFWMHNTLLPLSIAFINSKGVITEIVDMKPLDESVIRSKHKVVYALEVNQGWFKKRNIKPGAKIKEL